MPLTTTLGAVITAVTDRLRPPRGYRPRRPPAGLSTSTPLSRDWWDHLATGRLICPPGCSITPESAASEAHYWDTPSHTITDLLPITCGELILLEALWRTYPDPDPARLPEDLTVWRTAGIDEDAMLGTPDTALNLIPLLDWLDVFDAPTAARWAGLYARAGMTPEEAHAAHGTYTLEQLRLMAGLT